MVESSELRELQGKRVIGYNLGYFGVFLSNMLISVFAFQFYVYTVNLNSVLATIGLFLQLITGAIFSIVFGVIIDNKKPGKLGKRRPFLLYGLPLWFLTSFLLWIPPWYCPPDNTFFVPVAIYYWTVLIVNAFFGNLILVAHGSMLPGQSQTEQNRKKIAGVGTILVIFGSFIAMFFPLIVQSLLPDPQNVRWWQTSGNLIVQLMPYVGGLFAIFGGIAVIMTYLSVDESFLKEFNPEDLNKRSIKNVFRDMKKPAKDAKFQKFVMSNFFIQFAGRVIALVVMPFLTFVLIFLGSQYYIYMLVSVFCKLGWFYFWKLYLKRNEIIKTFSLCLIFSVIASGFELIYLLAFLSFEIKIALFFVTYGTVLGSMYGTGLFVGPVSSALIDEAARKDLKTTQDLAVSEIAGAYSGFNIFMLTIGQAIASIIIGIVLEGDNGENPVIITLIMASAGIAYLCAFLFISRIKLEKK